MTINIKNTWTVGDPVAVSYLQSTLGAGDLILNGSLAKYSQPGSNEISFLDSGFVRSVSLTSANDLTGVNFTIKGKQNGEYIEVILAGPNNTTVVTNRSFDVITSVSVNGAVDAVSVGTGNTGYLELIEVDTYIGMTNLNYALQTVLSVGHGITYDLYTSLADIPNLNMSYDALIADTTYFHDVVTDGTDPIFLQDVLTTKYFLLRITASDIDNDTLQSIFLQIQ